MRERPILFSGSMVCALLAGTKTQTRRIVKPQPEANCLGDPIRSVQLLANGNWGAFDDCGLACGGSEWRCPYGQPGDRLWVKETHRNNGENVVYRAGGEADPVPIEINTGMMPEGGHWRPSIFMPRWASRITLELTAVRVERLNDISEADAKAEGIEQVAAGNVLAGDFAWQNYRFKTAHPRRGVTITDEEHRVLGYHDPRASYRSLWESINGADSWAQNPWVWVFSFRVLNPQSQST